MDSGAYQSEGCVGFPFHQLVKHSQVTLIVSLVQKYLVVALGET